MAVGMSILFVVWWCGVSAAGMETGVVAEISAVEERIPVTYTLRMVTEGTTSQTQQAMDACWDSMFRNMIQDGIDKKKSAVTDLWQMRITSVWNIRFRDESNIGWENILRHIRCRRFASIFPVDHAGVEDGEFAAGALPSSSQGEEQLLNIELPLHLTADRRKTLLALIAYSQGVSACITSRPKECVVTLEKTCHQTPVEHVLEIKISATDSPKMKKQISCCRIQ